MSLKKLVAFAFLLVHFCLKSQSQGEDVFTILQKSPDTLYLPFNEDGLQLIIINSYDNWMRKGILYDAMYPRGGSWLIDNGPAPKNSYLWRKKNGELIKQYNTEAGHEFGLRSTEYTNRTNFHSIAADVSDYNEFNQHFMFYGENDKVGLIDLKGEIVIPATFDEIRRFQNSSDDKILVQKDGKFGFLDLNLKELFPPIYSIKNGYPEHNLLNEKYLKVVKDEKFGLINENGEVFIDFLFDEIRLIHDSLYIGLIYNDSSEVKKHYVYSHWDWGYQVKDCYVFDKNFKVITELKDYEYIYYWGIKQFIVKKNNQFGVLNHKGESVIPLEYDNISSYEGYYSVRREDKCGLIDKQGNIVLPIEFTSVQFYNQAVYVTQNGLIGVYSSKFQLIAKPQFKYKTWEMGKYILTREDGSKGFVNHTVEKGSYYQSPEGEIRQL